MADSSRILYNSTHRIIICRACETAVPPKGLYRHLSLNHSVPTEENKEIKEYVRGLDLADVETAKTVRHGEQPIPGIKTSEGFICTTCNYCAISKDKVAQHARKVHDWSSRTGQTILKHGLMQTVFQSQLRKYFEVSGDVPRVPINENQKRRRITCETAPRQTIAFALEEEEAIDRLLQEDNERKRLQTLTQTQESEDDPCRITPWLQRTKWLIVWKDQDMKAVAEMAHPSRLQGDWIGLLWKSVMRVMNAGRACYKKWYKEEQESALLFQWLATSHQSDVENKPFNVNILDETHTKYSAYMAQCLCYRAEMSRLQTWNGHNSTQDEEDEIVELLNKAREIDEKDNKKLVALDEAVLRLCTLMWKAQGNQGAKSTIIHFCNVLGISSKTGAYRSPGRYGQYLAGLVYCARTIGFYCLFGRTARENIHDPLQILNDYRSKWLVNGRSTPFGYINSLLAYARKISTIEGSDRDAQVFWNSDQTAIFYSGEKLEMAWFTSYIKTLQDTALDQIYALTFRYRDTAPLDQLVQIKELQDSIGNTTVNYTFTEDVSNTPNKWKKTILARALRMPEDQRVIEIRANGNIQPKCKSWAKYLKRIATMRRLLALVIYLTGGGPPRATELATIQVKNTASHMRNIFIFDGEMMTTTAYSKTDSITQQTKVIARFLPHWLAEIVATYLLEVLPFAEMVQPNYIPALSKPYLFSDAKGKLTTQQLTTILRNTSIEEMGFELTVSSYRQIAVSIDRVKVRGIDYHRNDAEPWDDPADVQTGHSTRVADLHYGLDASMLRTLNQKSLDAFRKVSHDWHAFISPKKEIEIENSHRNAQVPPPIKRQKNNKWTYIEVEEEFRLMMGDGATYRSSTQKEALMAIASNQSPIVVVMPTGGGKSVLFQLPARLPGARTTIVVVPFTKLRDDLVRRSRALGISCTKWDSAEHDENTPVTQLVVVVVESAVTPAFQSFLGNLQASEGLDRIVIDEAHMVFEDGHWRPAFTRLCSLRKFKCQFIALTGTLPPTLEKELENSLLLGTRAKGLAYYRMSTNRPDIEYKVRIGDKDARLQRNIKQGQKHQQYKSIIFNNTRAECDRIAGLVGCWRYHRGDTSTEEDFRQWTKAKKGTIAATSVLGVGVDTPGVWETVFIDAPRGAIDYMQASGRGARCADVRYSRSSILLDEEEHAKIQAWMNQGPHREELSKTAMYDFILTTSCRRAILTKFLDGWAEHCDEVGQEENRKCDNCAKKGKSRNVALQLNVERNGQTMQHRPLPETSVQQKRITTDPVVARAPSHTRTVGLPNEFTKEQNEGPIQWRENVRIQARQEQQIRNLRARFEGTALTECIACDLFVASRESNQQTHTVNNCSWLYRQEDILQEEEHLQHAFSKTMSKSSCGGFAPNSCCFGCGVPADWCDQYVSREKCTYGINIVLCVSVIGWLQGGETREILRELSQTSSIHEFGPWARKQVLFAGKKGTNAMLAAVAVLQSIGWEHAS